MKKPLKILLKTVYWILLVVFALLIGFGIYSANAAAFGKNKLPMPFGYGGAVVLSGSMEPELSVDDLILVREEASYCVGDVVVFQDGESLVVHRIIKFLDETTVQTQGDANNTPDAPIDIARIKGRAFYRIAHVGTAFDMIRSPLGTAVIIGLAIFLLWAAARADRREDEKEKEAILEEIRRLKHAAAPSEPPSESEADAHAKE